MSATTVEGGMAAASPYPVWLEGELDPGLSRWQWLLKWLFALPHYVVLFALWIGALIGTVIAFFWILVTASYPRPIFDYVVGVMRWTWRVAFYAFSPAGTDQYPPFRLADADYPARLDVEYPEQLSRGLVLVKWWLLALPHYLVVGLFSSGVATTYDGGDTYESGFSLIGALVLIAVIVLLFRGRYPRGIFDLVVGLNRWSFRVGAYALLLRDEYPPFRLDQGPTEPVSAARAPDSGGGA